MKMIFVSLVSLYLLVSVFSPCPKITPVSDEILNGYATRYWDCCKPHCAWASNAGSNIIGGGNKTKMCNFDQEFITKGTSACDGGPATACYTQIPFTIDDCEYGFAFAAAPARSGRTCGKCYRLDLDINKTLIIMANNIGYDVEGGQFDLMIPGGGVGLFNGCKNWDQSKMGEQYGGLLSLCGAGEVECLREKCADAFDNDPLAKKGCLFLADFLDAADNPKLTYQQVECPDVLREKY